MCTSTCKGMLTRTVLRGVLPDLPCICCGAVWVWPRVVFCNSWIRVKVCWEKGNLLVA